MKTQQSAEELLTFSFRVFGVASSEGGESGRPIVAGNPDLRFDEREEKEVNPPLLYRFL
jgi:hypothetical protein